LHDYNYSVMKYFVFVNIFQSTVTYDFYCFCVTVCCLLPHEINDDYFHTWSLSIILILPCLSHCSTTRSHITFWTDGANAVPMRTMQKSKPYITFVPIVIALFLSIMLQCMCMYYAPMGLKCHSSGSAELDKSITDQEHV
jgi:hypothetical protein